MKTSAGNFVGKAFIGLSILLFAVSAFAQPDPCNILPGTCRTQTMGGWGAPCNGQNPGCLLQDNFATIFPSGSLVVGGTYTLTFTSSTAIMNFLPATGTPEVLMNSYTNPTSTEAGVFAGQVVALAISLAFSNAEYPTFCSNLGELVIPTGVHVPTGPFAGWTVNQIFQLANQVLGGNTAALPAGISVSDLNDVVDAINNNFDDGTVNEGYLVEPDCDEILPVELNSFTAVGAVNSVNLTWVTASERNIASYELERRVSDGAWQSAAHVTGLGDNAAGHTYNYRDATVVNGTTYSYRLKTREVDGSVHPLGMTVSATPGSEALPVVYALDQNYPNPFNPSTSISFDLVENGFVSLKVYNMIGQEIATLMSDNLAAGHHSISFNAADLPSGLYIYRMDASGFSATRKMLLMK